MISLPLIYSLRWTGVSLKKEQTHLSPDGQAHLVAEGRCFGVQVFGADACLTWMFWWLENWAVLHVQQIRTDRARIFINASSENMTANRKLVNCPLTPCKALSIQSTHFRSLLTSWKWSRNIFAKISGLQNPSCCWILQKLCLFRLCHRRSVDDSLMLSK